MWKLRLISDIKTGETEFSFLSEDEYKIFSVDGSVAIKTETPKFRR